MKIYLNTADESWVVDRFRSEWINFNEEFITKNIKEADIIWLIAPWIWKKIPRKYLKEKLVVCTIHHIDFDKFDKKEEKNFYKRDKFVDTYHSISDNTTKSLNTLTKKIITTIPFWINQNIFYDMPEQKKIRKKYDLNPDSYFIGSFQRDTEGNDLISPKTSKGPDRLIKIFKYHYENNKNVEILLTGKRRNFIIGELKKFQIPYKYFEMVNFNQLNELYNCLNLYVVASRVEGGPQAIMECAITKTPIISTDVGIASKILNQKSIFTMDNFSFAKTDTEYAYSKSISYCIPDWFDEFKNLFGDLLSK
tara:strand:+ start:3129 stop:4052 length:924 start_codon:yes stop_codon:yes gene_type:complete